MGALYQIPPGIVTPDSIIHKCTDEFTVENTLYNPHYLRQDAFDPFMPQNRVEATIRKHLVGIHNADVRRLVEYSIRNPRVFLTLAMTKLVRKIPLLRSGNFADDDLPVRWKYDQWAVLRVYSMERDQNRPWQCFVHGQDDTSSWDFADIKQFSSNQWLFLAVIFENYSLKYNIHRDCPLPYINLAVGTPKEGHFGKVFKLGLQTKHIKANLRRYLRAVTHKSRPAYEVAVKRLRVDGSEEEEELRKFFNKETHTLETMRGLHHPHLIEAIAAYDKGPDRCFVFPWASGGNLREIWNGTDGPADQQVTHWAWRQIQGLTEGLEKLHESGTRHGDLKPENILMFDGDGESGPDPLVIADVGIAKFHADNTRTRQAQGYVTTNKTGTLRYESPEVELHLRWHIPLTISRKHDSWSLGCILLEFIIWLVRGKDGLGTFHNERLTSGSIDSFWYQRSMDDPKERPILHPTAKLWINERLPQDLASTALQDLLDLVACRLLVVPVEERASIQEFRRSLKKIHDSCSADPFYLWNASDTELTRRREYVAEVTTDFVEPLSQRPPLVVVPECESAPNPMTTGLDINNIYQPRTSTLVDKWETVTEPSLVQELLEGLNWTQWLGTRQLAASPSSLCRECAAIDFASPSYELKRSLQDLHKSVDKCALCGFLGRRISALGAVPPHEPLRLVRVGAKVKVDPSSQSTAIPAETFHTVLKSDSPPHDFAQIGLPLILGAASAEQFALLNLLVRHCDKTHDCMTAQEHRSSPAKLPTRVIDVGKNDTESIRLLETSQKLEVSGRYIALSHRWGDLSREQRCCTYTENIAQRKERIENDELPASFQDAVRVTRALGVRYLWIDSLCIIQEGPDDWAVVAGRMEDVFSHAYCTIAASSASSSLAGFLGGRRPRDAIMLPTPGRAPLYLAEDVDDFRADVENSILNSRGWVLQERALSKRTIYFTSTQVYWECGNGVVCETLAQLRNPQSQFLGDSNFPLFGLQFYKDERIRLVQHFYAMYSALSLSQPTDLCRALAGLQRRIARAFGSAAAHGVLWRWPERTLLWRAARPGSLTKINYNLQGGAPPSWSWMAYDGRIMFMGIPFAGVEWTGNVRGPADDEGDARVSAVASGLCVGGEQLMKRAVLDVRGVTFDEGSWKGVLVGKKKDGKEGEAAHYVLLVRPVPSSSSGPSDDLYERVGVAILLASHLSVETSSIFII